MWEIFDPDMFAARILDIGIPLDDLRLSENTRKEIAELEINYLEEVLLFENPAKEIKELKNFFIPLFLTSSPVHLDGEIPENETNRLVAKVKDSVEYLKALFY